MKHVKLFEHFINEASVSSVKNLRNEFSSLIYDLDTESYSSYFNSDNPLPAFGRLLGDEEKLKTEYKEWLAKKKISNDDGWLKKNVEKFLEETGNEKKILAAFKKKKVDTEKRLEQIAVELGKMYPVLNKIKNEEYEASPVVGTKISKYGNSWSIETPIYDMDNIKLSAAEVEEYKKYLKDSR